MFKLSPVFSGLRREILMPLLKLRPSELDILLKKTDFSKDDIQEWYQIFLKQCPDGKLDKDTVLDLLEGRKKINKYFSRMPVNVFFVILKSKLYKREFVIFIGGRFW